MATDVNFIVLLKKSAIGQSQTSTVNPNGPK